MNRYLAKFSDFNRIYENQLDEFKKSRKQKVKKKNKAKHKKQIITEINNAKGLTYDEFLKSQYWYDVRQIVIERDKNECTICHKKYNLRVHHISYKHRGMEHKFLDDLTTVCNECHKIIHGII